MFKMQLFRPKPLITDSISTTIRKLQDCSTYGLDLVHDMEQAIIASSLFCNTLPKPEKPQPGIIKLEHDLLEVGATREIAQGVFYMLPLYHEEKLFVR